jgi:fructose-1,6-bisphosphatase/inositol monophosphatase family enzyme
VPPGGALGFELLSDAGGHKFVRAFFRAQTMDQLRNQQSLNAWDMAAGVVIVEEAGGLVTDTLGRPLDLMNGTVLASTPALQAELLAALAPVD